MIPEQIQRWLDRQGIEELRPSQKKSVDAGLFDENNILVCTPTASGKTLVGEMAMRHTPGTSVYIVPLKALASEKYQDFKENHPEERVRLATGDADESVGRYSDATMLITTSEKLDSMLRHDTNWIQGVGCVVVDEIHLLNDPHRGPTLEVVLTLLQRLSSAQIIGLSATIGNPEELADWLRAKCVEDDWRPVTLHEGTYLNGTIQFYDTEKSTSTGK